MEALCRYFCAAISYRAEFLTRASGLGWAGIWMDVPGAIVMYWVGVKMTLR